MQTIIFLPPIEFLYIFMDFVEGFDYFNLLVPIEMI